VEKSGKAVHSEDIRIFYKNRGILDELKIGGELNLSTEIQIFDNGPIHVKGDFDLKDGQGKSFPKKEEAYLCRCNLSSNKPFCDGQHEGNLSHCARVENA